MSSLTKFRFTRTLSNRPRLSLLTRSYNSLQPNLCQMASSIPRGRGHRGRPRSRGGFRTGTQGLISAGHSRSVMTSARSTPQLDVVDMSIIASSSKTPTSTAGEGPRFADFPELSEGLLRALPFERCTEVRAGGTETAPSTQF